MGLLSLGTPLHWEEANKYADHVRKNGIEQFLNIYRKNKDRQNDAHLWGDEIEYIVVSFDDEHRKARISVRAYDMLARLTKKEQEANTPEKLAALQSLWRPEYGRFMLEATPGHPYGPELSDLLTIQPNMERRRHLAQQQCGPHEVPLTITCFPRLGTPDAVDGPNETTGLASKSLFLPDEVINLHARFPTLTANIRKRRGTKVAINMPIFHDVNTPRPFIDPTIPRDQLYFPEYAKSDLRNARPDHIYMDAMGFGMGCCCLQITFQGANVDEARRLYDQLAPVSSIMLALTASTPIFRGYLADVDCRWKVISQAVDDRTDEERGLKPLQHNKFVINKSRYDSIDSYLGSSDHLLRPEYNDIDLVYDPEIFAKLVSEGLDKNLARHIAHLFIRDPLVIFRELLDVDNEQSSDHFENLQSTNWQSMRFKPPPPNSPIGWRVEFRTMEVQFTDFANTAFTTFIVLLTRAILSQGLNFYIPISKVDINMDVAHHRNARMTEKFYFRNNVFTDHSLSVPTNGHTNGHEAINGNGHVNGNGVANINGHGPTHRTSSLGPIKDEYSLMSIDEIMNGKADGFIGLIPLVNAHLDSVEVDRPTRKQIDKYLDFVSKRASGELLTEASWIRQFVQNHPAYRHDSVISPEVNYDLLRAIERIIRGEYRPEGLY